MWQGPTSWRRRARRRNRQQEELDEARGHLRDFVASRRGVEAFVEPPTAFLPPTVLLVAADGEWTRRRAPRPELVRELAVELAVPVYDVQLVGYPQRMRDFNARRRNAPTD